MGVAETKTTALGSRAGETGVSWRVLGDSIDGVAPTRACSGALHQQGDATARAGLRRRRCVDGRCGFGEGQVPHVLAWGSRREQGDTGIAAAYGTEWPSRAGSRGFAAAMTRSPVGGAALG